MFSFATVLEHILVWRLVNILEIRYIAAVILLMPCVKRLKMLLVFFNTSAWVEWYEHTYFVCSPMKMVLKYSKIMSINHYFLDILSTRATLKFPHKLKAALNCIYRKGMVLFGATQLNPRLKPISNEPFVKSNKTVFPLDFWSKSPSNFTHPFI